MRKIKNSYPLVILSLIFLFNPNVNLIDVLPDFIAYLLLVLAIGALSDAVPYLAECKEATVKLLLVSVIKIPALAVMRANLISGKDIVPLFTLVFAVLELILIYSAVSNGFKALGYIGERTDSSSVRDSFKVGIGGRSTPEGLRIMTFIFFASKATLNVIPELFLLTPEETELRKRLADAYPTVLVISILTALVIGIIWLTHALSYVRAIKAGKDIGNAIESLRAKESPDRISEKERLKKLLASLTLLSASSLLIFDITISDFGGYNILPHFIYGILLFCSVYNFSSDKRIKLGLIASASAHAVCSLLSHFFTVRFFDTYSYADIEYSVSAQDAYFPIKLFSVLELGCILLLLSAAAVAAVGFIKENTDLSPSDPSYSRTNAKNHKAAALKTLSIFAISAIINLLKCISVFIKQTTTVIESDASTEGIVTSGMPAFDTVIFFICLIFVIYSFFTISNLKDEVKFKYGKD